MASNESSWNFETSNATMLIYPRRIDWDQSQPRAHTCKLAEDDETPWRQAQQRPKPELRLETTATRVLCTPRHWCNNAPPKLTKRKNALRTRPSQAEKQNFSYPPAEKPDKPNFVVQLHRRARMNRRAGALKSRSEKLGLRRIISNNE